MNHIKSRPLNPNEIGGISKDSRCYFNHYNNQVLAVIGLFKGEPCFVAQKPLPILEVSFIINDFISRSAAKAKTA